MKKIITLFALVIILVGCKTQQASCPSYDGPSYKVKKLNKKYYTSHDGPYFKLKKHNKRYYRKIRTREFDFSKRN